MLAPIFNLEELSEPKQHIGNLKQFRQATMTSLHFVQLQL